MPEPTGAPAPDTRETSPPPRESDRAAAPREVHCTDALAWLAERTPLPAASFVTSLPDVCEVSLDFAAWRAWFVDAAAAVLRATPPEGVAIFYQTDIKHAGVWVDKSHLVQLAGERCGRMLAWHKIACRKPAGTVMFGRPGYSHLLCLAHAPRPEPDGLPDVFAAGAMTWTRAMGVDACRLACTYIQRHTPTRTVVDPFCGRGTVLAAANAVGLAAVGVDLSAKRCRIAERLTLEP